MRISLYVIFHLLAVHLRLIKFNTWGNFPGGLEAESLPSHVRDMG